MRSLEKWALESQCVGGTFNRQADGFIIYSGSPTNVISGLDYHEGKEVVVWADGADVGTASDGTLLYTVQNGAITLSEPASSVIVGLPYTATYKGTKLAHAGDSGTGLAQPKKITQIGLIMADTHAQGLEYGPDFDTMDPLPQMEREAIVDEDYIHTAYDNQMIEFPGEWDTDSRLCLRATAPRPVTILAAVIAIEGHEKS